MSPCVKRQLVATGRRSRTCATLSNSMQTSRRPPQERSYHLRTCDRSLISPTALRPISCRSTPERSCRQRSCGRSVAVRRQSAHVASDPTTDQLPFDARALMSPATLRPIGRSQSQRVADDQSSDSCRPEPVVR